VKELNKTFQDLKMKIETIKKSLREATLEIENLGKRSKSHRYKHHQQNTRDRRIPDIEDTIEIIDTTVKENTKSKKLLSQNIQEIQDNKKTKPKNNRYRRE
jgi:predicted RNase H-like nuclease (RuvC/YqgF family)